MIILQTLKRAVQRADAFDEFGSSSENMCKICPTYIRVCAQTLTHAMTKWAGEKWNAERKKKDQQAPFISSLVAKEYCVCRGCVCRGLV